MMQFDEMKILDELRRFPNMRLSQEAKARMLAQLREERQKRKRNRAFKAWAAGLAACVAVLVAVWGGNVFLTSPAVDSVPAGISHQPPEPPLTQPNWQTMDISQWEDVEYLGEDQAVAVYRDPALKKLYLAKDGKVSLLYESKQLDLSSPHIYPHPNHPDRYYVWFSEADDRTAVDHLMYVKVDGSHAEVANLPQPGHGSYRLEWSPSGNAAFYLAETAESHEGVIGIIDSQSLRFQALYGGIETPTENVESVVGMIRQWLAAWVDDATILLYHDGFFLLDAATQQVRPLAMELPESLRELSPLELARVKTSPRYMVMLVGQKKYDLDFYGKNRIVLVDLQEEQLYHPVSKMRGVNWEYEQLYLGALQEDTVLIGEIISHGPDGFELRVGKYDLENKAYEQQIVTMPDNGRMQVASHAISPNGRYLALTAVFVEKGKQVLCVLDLANRSVVKMISGGPLDFPSLSWLDQDTLQAGSVTYELK